MSAVILIWLVGKLTPRKYHFYKINNTNFCDQYLYDIYIYIYIQHIHPIIYNIITPKFLNIKYLVQISSYINVVSIFTGFFPLKSEAK